MCSSRCSSTISWRASICSPTACDSFRENCVVGIEANRETIARHVSHSLMLVTALAPLIGYDAAAKIAKSAYEKNVPLKDAAIAIRARHGGRRFDELVKPEDMVRPH